MDIPVITTKRERFSRFKYAEEFAHNIDDGIGESTVSWKMWRDHDTVEHDHDGDEYRTPNYVVEWSERV